MHLITNSAPVNLDGYKRVLEPGQWLVHDTNAFEIACIAPRGTIKVNYEGWRHFLATEDGPEAETRTVSSDKPVLIMRSGAIGDLLMLTPALRELKVQTGRKVALSCWPFYHNIFESDGQINPALIDELAPYPFPLARAGEFSHIIDLGNTMEMDHTQMAQDVFAKALDLPTPLPSYIPTYTVTEFEREAAKKHIFTGRPNLAVQPVASVPNRNYPPEKMLAAIFELEKRGWGVLILGKKGQVAPAPAHLQTPYIRNLTVHDLPLRESVAVLANCDAFLGNDSSFMHFAAALNVPSVTLHGPFKWQIRTAGYPNNFAISGTGECAGCSWHLPSGGSSPFPPDKPCSQTGVCSVMSSIEPGRVISKVDALRRK